MNSSELYNTLTNLLISQETVKTIAEGEANWGKNGEIHITTLQINDATTLLHDKIINSLLKAGAVFNEPHFEGKNYIPHSTAQKRKSLQIGAIININQVTIVDMFPHSDGNQRRILKTVSFFE